MRSGEAFDWKRINFVLEVPQLYYNNIIAYYFLGHDVLDRQMAIIHFVADTFW